MRRKAEDLNPERDKVARLPVKDIAPPACCELDAAVIELLMLEALYMLAKFAVESVARLRTLTRAGALFTALVLLVAHSFAFAGQTNLAWNANTDPRVTGYFLYYGQTSGSYTAKVDVANQTSSTLSNLLEGQTYYYAVTAYDLSRVESAYSNQATSTVPFSAPSANFSANKSTGAAPLAVTFTSTSSGTITGYSWNFGDGTSSTAQNPAHSYSTAGTYTVILSVSGPGGSNSLTKAAYITVSSAGVPKPAVVKHDFNGDGKDDILWRNSLTRVNAVWLMNGASISGGASITPVSDPTWIVAGIGDFDGEGHSDILWRNTVSGLNSIWLMNGYSISSSAFIQSVPDKNWTVAGIGDVDGDGKADILWRNTSTGQNCIWLMNGVTIASSAFLPTVADLNWTIAGVGGFNGTLNTTTGLVKTDILWRNTATGQNAIWFMDGTSVTSTAFITTVANAWTIAGVGDFNADGKADILWHNTATRENSIWLMNGASISSSAFITTVSDPNWTMVGTGDYNGDGKADILWRNKLTGDNSVWLMNGTSIASSAFITPLGDLNWAPVAH